MSIIFSGTPDLGNVGSPTPSSYCELMSEFSTSPTSVVAASPVDALSEQIVRPGRIRSTSLASDGEQPSGSPKFKSYSSCQHISLNIPFANLLTVSHTGYLYPLPEEIEKRRKLKTDVSSLIPMIPRTLEAQEITAKPDEISSKDFLMNFVSSCNASNEDHVEPQKIEKLQMLVPTKDEIIRYPDLAHSQRTVVNEDSMKGDEIKVNSVITQDDGDDLDRTVTPTNESNASDEDSFVKIPFFGPSNLDPGERSETLRSIDRHLGEFISSVKTPAQLGLSVDWSEFRDIETQLGNFSKQQGIFDKFVAEVRECGQSD
uniref:Uncharacterized protein n=1 Tax=Heterorhabditis bacteriophora TaxID=37862 RepID=A0A1I7XI14_HETBA